MNHWRLFTPEGTAAVASISIHGELQRLPIVDGRGRAAGWPSVGRFRVCWLWDERGVLDEVLVVGTIAGAELHLHGGPGAQRAVESWLDRRGFQRQVVGHLAAPTSLRHARALGSAWHGPLSPLRRHAEAAMMGPETGLPVPTTLRPSLDRCRRHARLGAFLRRPPIVALVGTANAGKSTLFNALVGGERALVAHEAGTTRDAVCALVLIRGIAIELRDTAGVEPEAAASTTAEMLVHVLSQPAETHWPVSAGQITLRVQGKSDLAKDRSGGVSGRTGDGISRLLDRIAGTLGLPHEGEADLWAPAHEDLQRWLASTPEAS